MPSKRAGGLDQFVPIETKLREKGGSWASHPCDFESLWAQIAVTLKALDWDPPVSAISLL